MAAKPATATRYISAKKVMAAVFYPLIPHFIVYILYLVGFKIVAVSAAVFYMQNNAGWTTG